MATSRKKSNKTNSRGKRIFLSLILACLVFTVIGLIVYFSSSEQAKQQTRPSFAATEQKDEAKIAIPPEKTWEYIKLLEQREVDKPTKITNSSTKDKSNKISQKSEKSVAVKSYNSNKTVVNKPKTSVEIKNVVPSKPTKTYSLQCAAFKNKESADKLQVKLLLKGFNANVAKSGVWYRVFVSGFSSKNQALNAKNKIKIVNCVLLK